MKQSKSYKDYVFVGIQILLFAAYLLPITIISIKLPEWLRYSGLFVLVLGLILGVVALLQLNTKLSPFPTPVLDGKLISTGAYSIARHPIYTALIFSGLGYSLYQESLYKLLIVLLLLILFYFKSEYEEKLLSKCFQSYSEYKNKVGRFFPKLKF